MGVFKEQLFRIKKRELFPLAHHLSSSYGIMGSRSSPPQQQQQQQGRSSLLFIIVVIIFTVYSR